MRAKYVFEKFTEDSDPISDMGIGLKFEDYFDTVVKAKKDTSENIAYIFTAKEIYYVYYLNSKDIYTSERKIGHANSLKEAKIFILNNYLKKYKINVDESLNEKFTEDSDPISDMGIGYSTKVLGSRSWRILEFIKSKGEEGASFTEIQYFIWVDSGKDPDKFWEKEQGSWNYSTQDRNKLGSRQSRGNWCTSLFGRGLLNMYCRKNPITKKWVFVKYPEPRTNIYKKQ